MSGETDLDELCFGPWRARRASGELLGPDGLERLEPKVMELLFLLGRQPGRVVSREEILAGLWPDVVVGDDTLARVVSKLRKALGDDAKAPRWIETIPKRGYRLLPAEPDPPAEPGLPAEPASPAPPRRRRLGLGAEAIFVVLVLGLGGAWLLRSAAPVNRPNTAAAAEAETLTSRANDLYFRYSLADNETAVELFERVVARYPEHAPAHAGLANALVQRVVRWPEGPALAGPTVEFRRLSDALASGNTRTERGRRLLARAARLAERAVELAPADAAAHKALGFVRSAQEDFPRALAAYRRAIELDPDAWGALINLGEVLELSGRAEEAVPYFAAAFEAMGRAYPRESARVGPWYAEVGLLVAQRHLAAGRREEAEHWYRRTIEIAPFHAGATGGLARLLRETGREAEAAALCTNLELRVGATDACRN